jgi:hypothetical protein
MRGSPSPPWPLTAVRGNLLTLEGQLLATDDRPNHKIVSGGNSSVRDLLLPRAPYRSPAVRWVWRAEVAAESGGFGERCEPPAVAVPAGAYGAAADMAGAYLS